MPTAITDTTATTATNNGTISVNEYIGYSTGINSGFGNVIGSSSQLHIDSDASGNLNLGLKAGSAVSGTDAMVIYLDTDGTVSGFSTTSGFTDTADGCRRAISGYDGSNRATLNFPSGFTANYAICLDTGFAGLWQLTNGGSHTFITSLNRNNTGLDYEMNLTLANLGLSAGSSFQYVATYLNESNAFRSDEFHGVSAYGGGNPGYTTVNLAGGDYNTFQSIDTTLLVDRTDDTNAAAAQVCNDALANDCSLRGAISKANADTTGSYTISFNASLNGTPITLNIPGIGEDANATGDLDIIDDLTISGNGVANTIVQAGTNNTNGIDRVFHVVSNVSVNLSNLTIRYGRNISVNGGGIENNGTLNISESTITQNAGFSGGGIHNTFRTVTISSSTISNNTGTYGGGISNDQGIVTLQQSTVSGNVASGNGGGIDSDAFGGAATLNVYNSTVSGNTASFSGGGILAYTGGAGNTTVNLINATIFNNGGFGGLNSWDNGAGTATFNLQNSLIADQAGATDNCTSVSGIFVSNDYNLDSDGTCSLSQPHDLPGGIANLGPLQNNGGSTQTHAPESDSDVIDAGNNTACAAAPINNVDQRGVSRPQNATCDIGAFEYVAPVAPGTSGGNGPGGVGVTDGSSNLELWLRSDKGVFSDTSCTTPATNGGTVGCWQDQSGNGLNVTRTTAGQRPGYQTALVNNLPALTFNGSQFLESVYNAGFHPSNFTLYSMSSVTGGTNYRTPIGNRNFTNCGYNLYANPSNTWEYWPNGSGGWTVLNGGPVTLNQWTMLTATFDSVNRNPFYANGTQMSTDAFGYVSCAAISSTPDFVIGNIQVSGAYPYIGNQSEVILFNLELSTLDRTLVDNYLSSKYGQSIPGANDHYDGDTLANGEFDLDVAGIGQLGGNQHTQAHSAGMIVVNNTFLNENGDWLLFGHKTPTNSNITTYLPTGSEWTNPNARHWARSWYIDVTEASTPNGTIDIIFDFSEAGMGSPSALPDNPVSNYRLLKRGDEVSDYTDITATSGATVVITGDQVQFLGVDVSVLGSNFTLGSLDEIDSPTALTLQSFTARAGTVPLAGLLALIGVAMIGWVLRRRS